MRVSQAAPTMQLLSLSTLLALQPHWLDIAVLWQQQQPDPGTARQLACWPQLHSRSSSICMRLGDMPRCAAAQKTPLLLHCLLQVLLGNNSLHGSVPGNLTSNSQLLVLSLSDNPGIMGTMPNSK